MGLRQARDRVLDNARVRGSHTDDDEAALKLGKRAARQELRELKQAVRQGGLTAQQEKRLWLLIIDELLGEDEGG